MGCNCKSQNNFNKLVNKFDAPKTEQSLIIKILYNFTNLIITMVVGILCCMLFIVMAIPLIAYMLVCILFGKEPVVRIPWLGRQKRLEKKLKIENDGRNK